MTSTESSELPIGEADPPCEPKRGRLLTFWRAAFVFFGVGAALMYVFHVQILTAAYDFLVFEDEPTDCRYAIIATPTPECYDAAAELMSNKSIDKILIVQEKPRRSVRAGAYPSAAELADKELTMREVDTAHARLITTQAMNPHQLCRELDAQIGDENANCLVLSTTTLSRYHRYVIDQALPENKAANYRVRAVSPGPLVNSNWWKSRTGVRCVLNHGLRLAFVATIGESEVNADDPYENLISEEPAL